MNRMKKFASIMLALVMAFALMAPAFASGETDTTPDETQTTAAAPVTGPQSITINGATKGHTYDAYQIFKGDLSADSTGNDLTNPVLSNIEWGNGVNADLALTTAKQVLGDDTLTTAAQVAAKLNDSNANAFAQAIKSALSTTPTTSGTAESDNLTINVDSVGYYLIKDHKDDVQDENDSITLFMLQVVGPTVVTAKAGVPTPDKKIVENDEKVNVGDYDIGETITFELSATLPNNFENYKTYKLVFHDTMSEGLTFDKVTSIKLGETEIFNDETAKTYVTAPAKDGHSLDVTFEDLKTVMTDAGNGSVITVTYTGHLNENAVVGNPGNPNTMHLEFSNNPNDEGKGETGETPDKEVIVFTFELDNNKVDGQNTETTLPGAEFVLKTATGDSTDVKYAVINAETHKFIRWSDVKIEGTNDDGETTTLVSDEDGLFQVIGIDAGTYYLEETKAPVGYNKLENDITVVITPSYDPNYQGTPGNDNVITELDVTVDGKDAAIDDDKGIGTGTIANNKGATLPETGGIGTKIFYAVGGLLTVGAVVLLVTKKRMNADDK